jgi:hypothetical protein
MDVPIHTDGCVNEIFGSLEQLLLCLQSFIFTVLSIELKNLFISLLIYLQSGCSIAAKESVPLAFECKYCSPRHRLTTEGGHGASETLNISDLL